MSKNIVLDTSVLMHEPESVFSFEDNNVIIPASVIEELNGLKDSNNSLKAKSAQDSLKILMELTEGLSDKNKGKVNLSDGGTLVIEMNHISFSKLKGTFDKDIVDNRILAVSKNYDDEFEDIETILISNDIGLVVKARTMGIKSEQYYNDLLIKELEEAYTGYREEVVEDMLITEFYRVGRVRLSKLNLKDSPYENEFIVMRGKYNENTVAYGRVVKYDGYRVVKKLEVGENNKFNGITPDGKDQEMAMDLLVDDNVSMVSILGPAGTGKTLLSLAVGLEHTLEADKYKRVLALKSLSAVGDEKPGFLPGDLNDKLDPYMDSYYDNLEFMYDSMGKSSKLEDILYSLEDKFEIASTGLMRGRTLPRLFIIVDEAQNLTKHEVKTLITRVGKNAKIVLCGDPTQIDHNYLNSVNNGMVYATETMKDSVRSGTIVLHGEGKRSDLASEAAEKL